MKKFKLNFLKMVRTLLGFVGVANGFCLLFVVNLIVKVVCGLERAMFLDTSTVAFATITTDFISFLDFRFPIYRACLKIISYYISLGLLRC